MTGHPAIDFENEYHRQKHYARELLKWDSIPSEGSREETLKKLFEEYDDDDDDLLSVAEFARIVDTYPARARAALEKMVQDGRAEEVHVGKRVKYRIKT